MITVGNYIPAPVVRQMDAGIEQIEPAEMRPVYVLLRETGWSGTDILNLRYDSCLQYIWNAKENRSIPYLCGEITKVGIPQQKDPVRDEVAETVKLLTEEAATKSTLENNPDKYLFNCYEGKCMGLPLSKPAFSKAVQKMIDSQDIRDADGTVSGMPRLLLYNGKSGISRTASPHAGRTERERNRS